MRKVMFSSVLLFALVIPFIMTYRLGWGAVITPYWLFGLIFFGLLSYLGLDLSNLPKAKISQLKDWLLVATIFLVIGSAFLSAITVRHQTAPTYQIHDMPLQLEAAIRFFLDGRNPYAVDYFGTPLEQWHYLETKVNPALYHFVLMPWYLLFSLPFYFASNLLFGFFDARLPLLALFGGLLFLAWQLFKKQAEKRRLFITLLAFNPATLGYFLEGRSDIFMFAFLFGAWFLLERKQYSFSAIFMALAFATKQSIWPIFPLYLVFLWAKSQLDLKKVSKWLLPFAITFLIIVLPFALWDLKAFWQSTIAYLAGSTAQSYPIAGYGWGMLLHQIGVIKSLEANYPFWIWQLVICLPLLVVLVRWLFKKPEVWRLVISYGILTMVFWYFSRYFNNSHLGYLAMVFVVGFFFSQLAGKVSKP